MTDYSKITALYSRISVGDEDRDGGESNSIQNQKIFLENYARGQHLTNIRHYIDDDESGTLLFAASTTRGKPRTPNAIPRTSWTRTCSCRPSRKC